jgi:hypothetical protein
MSFLQTLTSHFCLIPCLYSNHSCAIFVQSNMSFLQVFMCHFYVVPYISFSSFMYSSWCVEGWAKRVQVTRESKQKFESISSLVGKLELVAVRATTCMQSLVELEKWKYVAACLVSEVYQCTTTTLREKATCTVAHMQLVCSLAIIAPSALNMTLL